PTPTHQHTHHHTDALQLLYLPQGRGGAVLPGPPCRPGFSESFYTLFVPRDLLHGQSIFKGKLLLLLLAVDSEKWRVFFFLSSCFLLRPPFILWKWCVGVSNGYVLEWQSSLSLSLSLSL